MRRIGQLYRELVLIRDDLEPKEFPYCAGSVSIEHDLFGWKLRCGKEEVPCRSETEARFLVVFLDCGMTEIAIPRDDEYLKTILPLLERIKAKTDKIINSYCQSILDRKAREKLRYEVLAEIIK